jgi:hypothetical protein
MPDHAGYAVSIAVREHALNDAFRRAYHTGRNGHSVVRSFQQLPFPRGSVRLFFAPPVVTLAQAPTEHATLRVTGWGTVSIRLSSVPPLGETRDIQWEARLIARHGASVGSSSVNVKFKAENFELFLWQFDVLSGTPFSAEADGFLNGSQFKDQLEVWLRQAIRDFDFRIDVSFFGSIPGAGLLPVTTRSVAGALMIGVDVPVGQQATSGDPVLLRDFAGNNDIGLYINDVVVPLMLQESEQRIEAEIAAAGATLEGKLEITNEEGRFRVRGRASVSQGAANFSFAVVRQMLHTRPGASLFTLKGPMVVKSRTWPALSFRATDASVDVDRSWAVIVGEVVAGIISLGGFTVVIEAFISGLAASIAADINAAKVTERGPIARVRRSGDPVTRTAIEAFDIHEDGVFVGITSRLQITPPLVSGLKTIPRNFANRTIRYDVRLPFDARQDDPFLHIRWTVINVESGSVMLNDDNLALNRLTFQFNPASFGAQTNRFAVVCRVYRTLGPFVTELLNETFRLDIGPPLAPGAFVRWRYDVKNPQVALNASTEAYSYVGDQVVRRWSKFHRTDKPCRMAREQSRYTYSTEVLDDLPFPIHDMAGNRYRLCDYCFFGGPASSRSSL